MNSRLQRRAFFRAAGLALLPLARPSPLTGMLPKLTGLLPLSGGLVAGFPASADAQTAAQTATQTSAPAETSGADPGGTDVNLGVARAIDAMLERAHGLIGTPYRAGGTSPDTGFDCSGLAGFLYRDILGFQLPRSAHEIWKFGKSVERGDLRPGDLVFYNTLKRPYSHIGIYLGGNRFIHSPTSGGRVNIVDMDQRYWAARWNGAKRVAP